MIQRYTQSYRFALLLLLLLAGCGVEPTPENTLPPALPTGPHFSPVSLAEGERLRVVATTSIVADVVGQVGGDRIALTVLLPVGSDPHAFEPSPQDVAAIVEAHVLFANGAGLEPFLPNLLESSGAQDRAVALSDGLALIASGDHGYNPHTWFDPNNVLAWTFQVAEVLAELDPAHEADYRRNAAAYAARLRDLDAWIRQQVTSLPPERRLLVTDHAVLTYLAARYGLEEVGTILAGDDTLSAPSARDLAALEEVIRSRQVPAIFVGIHTRSGVAEQIAQDTGVRVVRLYTGSLGAADGPAATYLDLMRYDVSAIVEALNVTR